MSWQLCLILSTICIQLALIAAKARNAVNLLILIEQELRKARHSK